MCRKTHQAMVFAHLFNPTWFFEHEIRPIWRSYRPLRQAGGNHLFSVRPSSAVCGRTPRVQVEVVPVLSAYATKMRISLEAMGRPAR